MSTTMKDAQVISGGISYFSVETVKGPDGNPRTNPKTGLEITTELRHNALHGDLVTMSEYEFARLSAMGAVREPSSAPTRSAIPAPTPFGVPVPNEDQQMAAFAGPIMGHPAPSAGASDLQISRAEVAGALTPENAAAMEAEAGKLTDEQRAALEERAIIGANDDSAEAIGDKDYEGASKSALEAEVKRRQDSGREVTVEGTGSGGNVIKDDLILALEADDEAAEDED